MPRRNVRNPQKSAAHYQNRSIRGAPSVSDLLPFHPSLKFLIGDANKALPGPPHPDPPDTGVPRHLAQYESFLEANNSLPMSGASRRDPGSLVNMCVCYRQKNNIFAVTNAKVEKVVSVATVNSNIYSDPAWGSIFRISLPFTYAKICDSV